jgi:hypothetical protein
MFSAFLYCIPLVQFLSLPNHLKIVNPLQIKNDEMYLEIRLVFNCFQTLQYIFVVVVVWGPESRCTAACRLIVHAPCVFNVPTFTARRLHVTTTLEILAAKGATYWARNFR